MFHSHCRNWLVVGATILLVLAPAAAPAAGDGDDCGTGEYKEEHDHERARHALECGEVMPLADVLAAVRPHVSGRLIETEIEREKGLWIYELTYIDSGGHLVGIHVDARTGRILNTEDGE